MTIFDKLKKEKAALARRNELVEACFKKLTLWELYDIEEEGELEYIVGALENISECHWLYEIVDGLPDPADAGFEARLREAATIIVRKTEQELDDAVKGIEIIRSKLREDLSRLSN